MLKVTEVTPISLAYLCTGGFIVAFSMISLLIKEKAYIGEVVLGTGFGVVIGPHVLDIFNPRSWATDSDTITLEFMRIVLAIGLFAIGVELPKAYLAEHARSLLVMVVPTMAFGWLVCGGLLKAVFPNLSFVACLGISACLTPTDPILSHSIIHGKFARKRVPRHIRQIIAAESAVNDGMAYPFLTIAIYLIMEPSDRVAFEKWFLIGWLYQVILGTVLGTLLGIACSYLMRYTHAKGLIDRESYVAQFLALAFFTIGLVSTLGSDDLLAAFAAGSAVSWSGHFNTHTSHDVFSSVIDLILNCACFIYIGAWLPFNTYNSPEIGITPWRLVVVLIGILALRRIPCLLLIYKWIPDVRNWKEALFCGHFGPMGVGAMFISTLAISRLPHPQDPPASQMDLLALTLHPIVSFVILGSILIHGLSIPAFWFGSRTLSMTQTVSRSWTYRNTGQPEWVHWIRRTGLVDPTAPPSAGEGDEEKKVPEKDIEKGEPRKEHVAESSSEGATPSSWSPRATVIIGEEVCDVEKDICDNEIVGWDNSCYDGIKLKQVAKTRSGSAIAVGEGKTVRFEEGVGEVEDITHENAAANLEAIGRSDEDTSRASSRHGIAREDGAAEKLPKRVQFTEAQ